MRESAGFSASDQRIALALAKGCTRVDAAREAGVSERLVYLRLERPEFRALVDELRTRLIGDAVGKLSAAATEAAETLKALLGASHPAAVRLGASRAILSALIEVRGHLELSGRVAEIEARLAELRGPGAR
jgi:hypothetical protein